MKEDSVRNKELFCNKSAPVFILNIYFKICSITLPILPNKNIQSYTYFSKKKSMHYRTYIQKKLANTCIYILTYTYTLIKSQ